MKQIKIGDIVKANDREYVVREILDARCKPRPYVTGNPIYGSKVYERTNHTLGTDWCYVPKNSRAEDHPELSYACLYYRLKQHQKDPIKWPIERVYGEPPVSQAERR